MFVGLLDIVGSMGTTRAMSPSLSSLNMSAIHSQVRISLSLHDLTRDDLQYSPLHVGGGERQSHTYYSMWLRSEISGTFGL